MKETKAYRTMKRTSNFITTVVNTPNGWLEIEKIQQELGKPNVRLRGRHPNRKEFLQKVGRQYCSNIAYLNDINHRDLYMVREQDNELTIAVYHR